MPYKEGSYVLTRIYWTGGEYDRLRFGFILEVIPDVDYGTTYKVMFTRPTYTNWIHYLTKEDIIMEVS